MESAITLNDVHIIYKTVKSEKLHPLLPFKYGKVESFEAVKGVSFCVPQGEIVGLIGKNGSGKTTLLRSIAGIFSPNRGCIDVGDRKVSLLSLGVGFQPKLSGRDNIILSGLLMGFTKGQIREKMQEIIDFSELAEKIEMPVGTYSSGMYSKLAFSITVTLESDIILIDEVLSVGDEHFKEKSLQRMHEIISQSNKTVMIVSHSMSTLQNLCSQVIWLNDGKIVKIGETEQIIDEYKRFMKLK